MNSQACYCLFPEVIPVKGGCNRGTESIDAAVSHRVIIGNAIFKEPAIISRQIKPDVMLPGMLDQFATNLLQRAFFRRQQTMVIPRLPRGVNANIVCF